MGVRFEVHTIDGGFQEFPAKEDDLRKLKRLRHEGFTGIDIVHTLLGDDWAAPPSSVVLVGTLEDGTSIREAIPYDKRRG